MKNIIPQALLTMPILSTGLQAQEKQPTPNLVFIMADQYRGDAIGCIGKEPVKTPHLDKLASEGINFTNAISSYPVSSPARGMLMTGMYPIGSKVTGNCNSETAPYGVELSQNARCWSDVLKDQGYNMGYIGKWHLDAPYKPYVDTYNNRGKVAWNEWCPPERRHGFDHWIAYGTYDYHLKPMYWNTTAPRDSFYYVNQWGPEYEASKAIEYINKQKDQKQPFALVVSMNPPHTGYELVPDRYKEIYKDLDVEALCKGRPDIPAKGTEMGDYFRNNIRNYYACITGVDENVGRIIEALKQNNLFDNTIVVFTSDHGICMGAHENAGKDIFYEESMRIPMILSWPDQIKPRKSDPLMIAFADLYPTLLSMMGFSKEIPETVQTFDLSNEVLTGKNKKDLVQPYYFVKFDNHATGYRGLRTDRYTYAVHATDGKIDNVILFDRASEPYRGEVPGEKVEVKTYEALSIPNSDFNAGYDVTYPKSENPLYTFKGDWIGTRNPLTCHTDGANAFYVSKSSTLPVVDGERNVAHMMTLGWGAGNTCSFGNKDYWLGNSVINHISAGIVCVGDYEAAGDVVNGKAAYIRPTSMSFVYKAAPYKDDEYLIEAYLENITGEVETIIGKAYLKSGTAYSSYQTQTLNFEYNNEYRNLPISHVKIIFKAGTKEDRDHLEDKFRDAKGPYGDAYIIGSQFWLDSFTLHYDK